MFPKLLFDFPVPLLPDDNTVELVVDIKVRINPPSILEFPQKGTLI